MLSLKKIEWRSFNIEKNFAVSNSKPYHKKNLSAYNNESSEKSIPYISRTNKNNGVEEIVKKEKIFNINKKNRIAFGAENARFFFQPFDYITGNKMYSLSNKNINKFNGLFIQQSLNSSIENCGFSYGQGLTGTRAKRRPVLLPVNRKNEPDYEYMEEYTKSLMDKKINDYRKFAQDKLKKIEFKEVASLNDKNWKEFFLTDIFAKIQRGKRLTKGNQLSGNMPYVSSTATNNGVDNFVGNKSNVRVFSNCLTIANSGSVGSTFYHPYSFVASDHITHLENKNFNQFIYLFVASIVSRMDKKYNFNREINDKRISREKIMLPISDDEQPDYQYMEQYIKNITFKKITAYLEYLDRQTARG